MLMQMRMMRRTVVSEPLVLASFGSLVSSEAAHSPPPPLSFPFFSHLSLSLRSYRMRTN